MAHTQAVLSAAARGDYERLYKRVFVPQAGFVQAYVANESEQEVYFDNVTVEHRQGLQVQENHYDPFGLDLVGLSRSPGLKDLNQYSWNGKEKQAEFNLNWHDHGWRFYEPALGRWVVTDPSAEEADQESWTTYQFGMDNAVKYNDLDGRLPTIVIGALVGAGIGAGLAILDGKDTKDVLIAGAAGAVGGAIIGSGVGLLAPGGLTAAGISSFSVNGAVINGAAGFVAGAAQETTTQVLNNKGLNTHKIAANAVVTSAANIAGGIVAEKIITPGVKAIASKVAASTAARTVNQQAAGQVRNTLTKANPSLRNNNPRVNAAVGDVLRNRQKEAISAGKAAGKATEAAAQVSWERLTSWTSDAGNEKLGGHKLK